jgi:ABC-type polysaccharide/polyol phosphate export permease
MLHSLRHLLRYRVLIQTLVWRELKARYRGNALGFLWTFVHPLLLLGVYTFVFTFIFTPMRAESAGQPYALFLFCGLLPWMWFSSSLLESSNSLLMGGNLIKKIIFPAEVLPVVAVLSNTANFLLSLPIYVVFWVVFKTEGVTLHALELPIVLAIQFVFTLGLGLFLAALTVHYRDVRDLLANILTLWFFASPVIYARNFVPEELYWLININPMTHILDGYHEAIFNGGLIPWKRLGVTAAVSLLVFWAGYFFFDRLRDSFPEEV